MKKPMHNDHLYTGTHLILTTLAMSAMSLLVTWMVEQYAKELFRLW